MVALWSSEQVRAAENKKAEINQSNGEHHCGENYKSHSGVFRLGIDELGEERDIEQQRLGFNSVTSIPRPMIPPASAEDSFSTPVSAAGLNIERIVWTLR